MKVKSLIVVIFIAVTGILFAKEDLIGYFAAKSDGSDISIEWRSNDESNIKRFELERSSSSAAYKRIKTEFSSGQPSFYQYTDREAFLKQSGNNDQIQEKTAYTYRIKVIKNDNSDYYTDEVTVTHNVSSIRRTWGMIKEMFR